MSQQSSHILFYSNRCHHSQQFLQQLQQTGYANAITQVCIDNTPKHRIPNNVTSVPTLIIAGNMTPIVGDQAFLWLQEQVRQEQARQQQQSQNYASMGNTTASQAGGAPGNAESAGPEAWHGAEMGGSSYSDAYSFLDADTSSGSSIPKSFAFLGEGSSQPQNTPNQQQHPQQHQRQQQFPEMRTTTPDYGSHQQGQGQNLPMQSYQNSFTAPQNNQQHTYSPHTGIPNGRGSFPPNASMAPPSNSPSGDELNQRMQQMSMHRDQDIPQQMQRMA